MAQIGYAAMLEQFPPRDLVGFCEKAEAAGFSGVMAADHVQPWTPQQGNAAFVWSFMTAAAEHTKGDIGPGVTCPSFRSHPAIIAQAAATMAVMYPNRFWLGLGSGEALNEHIVAGYWPEVAERINRMFESIEIIRKLFSGKDVKHAGDYYKMETMRLWTLPEQPPPIYVATAGPVTAEKTGRFCDGLITVGAPEEKIEGVFQRFEKGAREAGKDPSTMPRILQLHLSWARDRRMISRKWPSSSGPKISRAACSSHRIRTPIAAKSRSSSTWGSTASICTTSVATSSSGLTSSAGRSSPSSTRADPHRPAAIAAAIDVELRRHRNPARAPAEKAYLKSDLDFLGVGLPVMRQAVRSVERQHGGLGHQGLVALVRILWSRPVFERRMMAVLLLEAFEPLLRPADIRLLEHLIRQSKTWAFVDELAIAITGPLVERSPKLLRVLDRWAEDDDFWLRRSAMLALLRPLRRGRGDFPRFARYAERMLADREFFIRKAIGWVLRETGKPQPDLVYSWLLPRAARASGVTVREAVKYLSSAQRAAVLAAYQSATRPEGPSGRAPR